MFLKSKQNDPTTGISNNVFSLHLCHARMREIWDIYIFLNLRYVAYYEAIINTKILMQFL